MKTSSSSITRISLHAPIKIVIVAIISAGLISVPLFTSIASARTPPPVVVGNTPALREHENLTPTPQPWEDGMRTDPMPGTFEWWYYQLQATDGSSAQLLFYSKPWFESPLPFDPLVSINIVTPNGTRFNDRTFYNTDDFSAARNQNNVTIGKNWVHGDLNTYELHAESQRGIGADLVFTRDAPSWQAGNSKWYFDKSLTQYFGWFPAVPSAKVEGTLTYNGQAHEVQGTGYHDHNWGTVDMNKVIDNWYWGQGRLGNYTIVFFPFVASSFYDYQQLPILYLAKGNDILIGDTSLMTWKASDNQTYAPFNRTYPGLLELNYKNGSDTVNLSITDPKILSASNSILVTNATTLGIPQYMRFSGTGELSVNMNGINETVSGPMTWEKNFAN